MKEGNIKRGYRNKGKKNCERGKRRKIKGMEEERNRRRGEMKEEEKRKRGEMEEEEKWIRRKNGRRGEM